MAMPTFVFLPTVLSELFAQTTLSDNLTHVDWDGLTAMVMSERLDENAKTAIACSLYATCQEKVR